MALGKMKFIRIRKQGMVRLGVMFGAWLLVVLSFACIYNFAWSSRSDSFIVNKQFNLAPVEALGSQFRSGGVAVQVQAAAPDISARFELDELMGDANKNIFASDEIEAELAEVRALYDKTERSRRPVAEQHEAKMVGNIEAYKEKFLKEYVADVLRSEKDVADLLGSAVQENDVRLMRAQSKLRESNGRMENAEMRAREYIYQNLGSFVDPKTTEKVLEIDAQLQELSRKEASLLQRRGDLWTEKLKLSSDWRRTRASRVEFVDFLYFSAGVSTSTAFGDIIPNSRPVRMAVLVQLLISIFLVGMMVTVLSESSFADQGDRPPG